MGQGLRPMWMCRGHYLLGRDLWLTRVCIGTGGLIALMLGRMRMDVESCKSYYVSLTRFVFITDKTLLGLPYGKTLFKASRLEEAIRHCVRESTRLDQDSITPQSPPLTDAPPRIAHRRTDSWRRRRRSSTTTTAEQDRAGAGDGSSISSSRRSMTRRPQAGNPETSLLDSRDGACKTFVTAMLEGSRKGTPPVLLRSYPSPVESVPSYRTTIWQAGRATCATAAAFKSITIDQTTFLDEGAGMYNPALQVLDEAHLHEFADCDVATFVSVGTGKRQQPSVTGSGAGAAAAAAAAAAEKREWWEGMAFEGFSEAKRRLVRRIDDCERVHRELVDGDDGGRPKLAQGGVAAQDYYRFNVEVGVGEFGMNEWNRLAEVATGTRRYLSQRETSRFVKECAAKLAAVAASRTQPQPQPQPQPQSHQQPKPQSQPQSSPQSPPPPQQLKSPPPPPPPPQPAPKSPPPPRVTAAVMPDEKAYKPTKHAPPQSHFPPPAARPADAQHPAVRPHPATQQYGGQRPGAAPTPPASSPPSPPPPPPPPKPPQMTPAPAPVRAPKEGKVLIPATEQTYYADDTPNPEVRLTSPTTVAGGSDDDGDGDMYGGYSRRRRRRRSRSRGRSLAGVVE